MASRRLRFAILGSLAFVGVAGCGGGSSFRANVGDCVGQDPFPTSIGLGGVTVAKVLDCQDPKAVSRIVKLLPMHGGGKDVCAPGQDMMTEPDGGVAYDPAGYFIHGPTMYCLAPDVVAGDCVAFEGMVGGYSKAACTLQARGERPAKVVTVMAGNDPNRCPARSTDTTLVFTRLPTVFCLQHQS